MNQPIANVFKFCPRCGTKSAGRSANSSADEGTNPFKCTAADCGYSHYFSPNAAVGSIIADADGRVLLITRAKDPGKGKFGMPGGFVDPGESLEEALRREVLEEINLKTISIEYLASFPNSYAFRGVVFPVTDAFFVCKVESFDPIAPQEGEVSDYHFLQLTETELDKMAFESNRLALELYLSRTAK